ncbi:Gfo/Idh/MocA family protein [Candidatus Latescibacterota bacterium]
MNSLPRVAIVGVGGFAGHHLTFVTAVAEQGLIQHVAQVAPPFDQENLSEQVEALRARGVTIYSSLRELLACGRHDVDLVTIPTGIPLHRSMTVACLEAGLHVLVEKPAAGSIQDVDAMIAARDGSGRHCAVGYQHVYQELGRTLKSWVCEGRFGAIRSLRAFGCWPRPPSYYGRNGWAGKLAVGDTWVLDGPHNNALSHAVNLMLYLGSSRAGGSLTPAKVQAELYRANPIESADTVSMRVSTSEGVEVYFAVSHCTDQNVNPQFTIEAEKARLVLDYMNDATICWRDGREETHHFGSAHTDELVDMVRVLHAHQVSPACPLEVARAETLCACGTYESSAVHALPPDLLSEGEDGVVVARGMTELVMQAYEKASLFSELDVPWAEPGEVICLEGYDYYPTFRMPGV